MARDEHLNDHWGSRLGVVLAVSGSAVGLGNFIRFPGQAAMNGGGAFMIPYLISLLVVAIPISASEWAMGRYGGRRGFHSPLGIYYAAGQRRPICGLCGGMFTFTAYVIDMYYLFVEAWCLVYALQYLGGLLAHVGLGFSLFPEIESGLNLGSSEAYGKAFESVSGASRDGALFSAAGWPVLATLALCTFANFFLIYHGISRGIERFCKMVAPLIMLCSLIVLVRVFTLGNPSGEEGRSLLDGLGFMWNPGSVRETLSQPAVWLAAASQIFFSTSLCTSAVCTYTSYVRPKQDVALSSVTATMANEFCEVCLGGMMILPPAIMFLGAAAADQIGSSFSLGFIVLPNVFGKMPAGEFFGFVFFSLLFFAAITSSISQLQPAVAFLKEALGWGHKRSVLGCVVAVLVGSTCVCWFTENLTALDSFDFWSANFAPFLCAIVQTSIVAFIWGLNGLQKELDQGAIVKLPRFIGPFIKYVTLPYLAAIFAFWLWKNSADRVESLLASRSAQLSTFFLLLVLIAMFLTSLYAVRRWKREERLAAGQEGKSENNE